MTSVGRCLLGASTQSFHRQRNPEVRMLAHTFLVRELARTLAFPPHSGASKPFFRGPEPRLLCLPLGEGDSQNRPGNADQELNSMAEALWELLHSRNLTLLSTRLSVLPCPPRCPHLPQDRAILAPQEYWLVCGPSPYVCSRSLLYRECICKSLHRSESFPFYKS